MQNFPHRYSVAAHGDAEGEVNLESARLPTLVTAAPSEFGGPGDRWSPETLLVASVADCFILTFRATARAGRLAWISLNCEVEGVLDRVERVTQFTEFHVRASLRVPPGTDEAHAQRLLVAAEEGCLVTRSLKATSHLSATVEIAA